jgi:hypothetical protein
MSDYISLVIKKIHDFKIKYYRVWTIEAHEALGEHSWMRQIDSITLKEIKEEDGSDIDIVEGLYTKALLSQLIKYEHKNRTHIYTTAVEILFTLEDEFAYKSYEDKQRFKALLSQIHKTSTEDLDTFIARFDELTT